MTIPEILKALEPNTGHFPKETHGTKEAWSIPAALTTRAKQEGQRNDKKRGLMNRESDWFIVVCHQGQAPEPAKGPTKQRSPQRQPDP